MPKRSSKNTSSDPEAPPLSEVLEMPKFSKLEIATEDESEQEDIVEGDWQVP